MNFADNAREVANSLPLDERLVVLTRFAFMEMAAGHVDAARALADQIDDGLQDARDSGLSVDEISTELSSLESWLEQASQEKPDPRREGVDLAQQILARPHAVSHLTEAVRTGKLKNLGSRAIGDAAEELYRRGEHGHARALLDGLTGTEAGHRARLRTGLLLKRDPVPGADSAALVAEAIADAAHMDSADGKSAKRQFLAGIALMSFDDIDVADGIIRQLHEEGQTGLSAGVKQRLARGLLDAGRADEAMAHLATIQSVTARELATAAVFEQVMDASGMEAAHTLVDRFKTPAAVASARGKLAERAAATDLDAARADLTTAIGSMVTLKESDPFFYPALCDVLSAYAAVDAPGASHDAAVIGLLGPASAFPAYRLRLAEHLAGALVKHRRQRYAATLSEQLDGAAAAVILMRASLP